MFLEDSIGAGTIAWALDATPTRTSGTDILNFTGFGQLIGDAGANNDTFTFIDGGPTGIAIDAGAGGTDIADYSGLTAPVTVNLGAGLTGITNVETIQGDGANDTLVGGNTMANSWNITNINDGNVNGTASFLDFNMLIAGTMGDTFNILNAASDVTGSITGNAGNDMFVFSDATNISGSIDGEAGSDTIDWSAFTTARSVDFTAATAQGFAGTEVTVGGGFSDIDTVIGGIPATDMLTGIGSTWNITMSGSGTYVSGGFTANFMSFETLVGDGTANDIFNISSNHTGTLFGAAGNDTFNFNGNFTVGQIAGGTGSDTLVGTASMETYTMASGACRYCCWWCCGTFCTN